MRFTYPIFAVVDELLQLSAEAATETFVTYIDDIFTNESYNVVLSGEESPVFEGKISQCCVTDLVNIRLHYVY
jgi:hypothetical protein